MKYEKSCGFVAYTNVPDGRRYLIIRSLDGEYGFPKGHVEGSETEHETAVRELKEETNAEVTIIPGFRRQIEYAFPNKPGVMKRTVYFIGEYAAGEIVCREGEVSEAAFHSFEKAYELLSFEDTRNILKEADAFLRSTATQ